MTLILYNTFCVVKAIPFKYTWEGGNATYFRPPPPIEEEKIPPTTTRIYIYF
jgi:hypothetical protein